MTLALCMGKYFYDRKWKFNLDIEHKQEIGKLAAEAYFQLRPTAKPKYTRSVEPEGTFTVLIYPFNFVDVIHQIIDLYLRDKTTLHDQN